MLEVQKQDCWQRIIRAEVHNLYRLQAEAQVIERMLEDYRGRISASTQQSRGRIH